MEREKVNLLFSLIYAANKLMGDSPLKVWVVVFHPLNLSHNFSFLNEP